MSQYKLIYFNSPGSAQTSRLIFAVAGVPYEDVRIPKEKWPEIESTTPMGELPLLETDGTIFFQGLAIARYLARKFGLAGNTEIEQAKVDATVDSIEEIATALHQFWGLEKVDSNKVALSKVFIKEMLATHLNSLEKLLKSNNNGDGYFVGDSLTWAELHFLSILIRIEIHVEMILPLKNYPKLEALFDRLCNLPQMQEWIAKRPETLP